MVASARSRRPRDRTSADQLARHLCASQQIRLHRNPLSHSRQGAGQRRGPVPVGDRRGQAHDRSGQRRDRRPRALCFRSRELPEGRRFRPRASRYDRVHRRFAQAGGVGRGRADPVPRERRCQSRVDGLEHAAPSGTLDASRGPAGGNRDGGDCRSRFGRHHRRQAGRDRRPGRCDANRGARDGRDRSVNLDGRHLQPSQVPAF